MTKTARKVILKQLFEKTTGSSKLTRISTAIITAVEKHKMRKIELEDFDIGYSSKFMVCRTAEKLSNKVNFTEIQKVRMNKKDKLRHLPIAASRVSTSGYQVEQRVAKMLKNKSRILDLSGLDFEDVTRKEACVRNALWRRMITLDDVTVSNIPVDYKTKRIVTASTSKKKPLPQKKKVAEQLTLDNVEVKETAVTPTVIEDDGTQIHITVDNATKEESTKVLNNLGLTMTTAITVFLKQVIRTKSIPFAVVLDKDE